jgi:hypothetical protein
VEGGQEKRNGIERGQGINNQNTSAMLTYILAVSKLP